MADGAGRAISSTFLLLAVLVAASAATSLRVVAAAAPAGGGSVQAGGASRETMPASRFLAAAVTRKQVGVGRRACRPGHRGACSGAGAGAAGERRKCCGRACTDVLTSASNCGACGRRCPFGRMCCGGRCVAVADDAENCGACGRACAAGLPCTYGMCGYA